MTGYDFIGDVHGNADKLETLLHKMGYRRRNGTWQHSGRTAVFVGDLIDRGPAQLRTIDIARRMRDAANAHIVLGNHEFNAVCWVTPDPEQPEATLRPHTASKRRQHEAFLAEVGEGTALHHELVDWFSTIPLWLDLDGIRVVHACWHLQSMTAISSLLDNGCLTGELVVASSRAGSVEHDAIEVLLKGPELALPHPFHYLDKDGTRRTMARQRWWDRHALTYATSAHIPNGALDVHGKPIGSLPDTPFVGTGIAPYTDDAPLIVGHYWLTGQPTPITPVVACVDYSAGSGGPLVAYRWDGETELHPDHFVASDATPD